MKTMRGFTVLEMTVTVAIIAMIAAMAIPSFRDMVAANRQVTVANLFVASFNLARNEAITRSANIDITAKDGDWKNGWTITTTNGTVTTTIASYEALPAELNITGQPDMTVPAKPVEKITSDPPVSFQYNRQGRLALVDEESMSSVQTITLCDRRTGEAGRLIVFVPIGRVTTGSVTCN